MMKTRLVCIRVKEVTEVMDAQYKRLPLEEAIRLVEKGSWVFTSKGKYRRYMKEMRKYTEKQLIKEDKSVIRPSRVNKVYPNDAKDDLPKPNNGTIMTEYNLHSSIKHLVSTDPLTGKKLYAKEGKGNIIKTIYNILKKW